MATKKVEDYAYRYGLSNRQAKKRLGKGARSATTLAVHRLSTPGVSSTGSRKAARRKKHG